jgi:hypothetical protein
MASKSKAVGQEDPIQVTSPDRLQDLMNIRSKQRLSARDQDLFGTHGLGFGEQLLDFLEAQQLSPRRASVGASDTLALAATGDLKNECAQQLNVPR